MSICLWCMGEGYGGDEHAPWTCSECDGTGKEQPINLSEIPLPDDFREE